MRPLARVMLGPSSRIVLRRWQSSAVGAVVEEARSREALPYSALPTAAGAWPVIGHLPFLLREDTQKRMHVAFEELRKESGDIFRLRIPGQGDLVALFRPEDIQTMHTNESQTPFSPGFEMFDQLRAHDLKDRYKSKGLLVNDDDWYNVRHLVQQDMMRPKSALYYTKSLDSIAEELADRIAAERGDSGTDIQDIHPLVQAFALESIGCIFMGTRLGAIKGQGDGKRLMELSEETLVLMQKLFFLPTSLQTFHPAWKKLIRSMAESFDLCKKHVDAAMDKVTDTDNSMIAKLVRACGRESGIALTMSIDSILAGIDTTGSSGTSLLYHLADNPEKQEKLHEEICSVLGPRGEVTEAALAKMRYLKACQTESQRMANASFATSRRLQEDTILGGYHIPAGTDLLRVGHSTSNDPANFTDPEIFLPERWLRGCPDRHTAHPFAHIPFGHGARSCIGQRFARLELYMLAVKLVQRFRLEQDGPCLGLVTNFVAQPDREVNIRFTER